MINKKLVLATLLAFSLTTTLFSTTIVHAEETQVPNTNNQLDEEPTNPDEDSEKPSITLVTDKWTGENDIVFNVQKKGTDVNVTEIYVYENDSSLGGIRVEPEINPDENGNDTITFKNNALKNIKTLLFSNDSLDWSKINKIEFIFAFSKNTEYVSSKTIYVPVEISKTPAPVETEKPKTTETVKKETKATTKNTQSNAVKTGDNTSITLYTSLLIISVIVVAGTIVLRKKKS